MTQHSQTKNHWPGYMFAVDKETLAWSLETLRRRICHYGPSAQRCDCKFASYGERPLGTIQALAEVPERFHYAIGQGEVSGCAEIEQAIRFLEAMTRPEFDRIYKRQMKARLWSRSERVKPGDSNVAMGDFTH